MCDQALKSLIKALYDIHAVKFGQFTLKSGVLSPVYFDLRVIVSYPDVMKTVGELLYNKIKDNIKFDLVCGVPYTALPIATCISVAQNIPMVMRRKEAKSYGTKKLIEGIFVAGQNCLVVEDVVTSGSSVMETVQELKREGLCVTDAVVLLDREQGGEENLLKQGIKVHSLCGMTQLMQVLQELEKVPEDVCKQVFDFIANNKCGSCLPEPETKCTKKNTEYKDRVELVSHPTTRQLLSIMDKKQSNLCVAVDVTNSAQLLKIAEAVGPHICILKTHIDIVEDFDQNLCKELCKLSKKYDFLIFEDRKFADIGNTVQLQYSKGIYRISEWADIVNAHPLPGPGLLKGMEKAGSPKGRACLLVAEMSSAGNLATKEYAQGALKMALDFPNFVIGFVSQSKLSDDPRLLHFTPGVKMISEGTECLGQQYVTPECAITERGADVVIVGRGITEASDPAKEAALYQQIAYNAYASSCK